MTLALLFFFFCCCRPYENLLGEGGAYLRGAMQKLDAMLEGEAVRLDSSGIQPFFFFFVSDLAIETKKSYDD